MKHDVIGTRIFVANLPLSVTEEELRQLFSQVGTVRTVDLLVYSGTGRQRGSCLIEMGNEAEASQAMRMFDGYLLDARPLRITHAAERKSYRGSSRKYRRPNARERRPAELPHRPERSPGR